MADKPVLLGTRTIDPGLPCYIIAEVGVNHNGSLDLAHKHIDAAHQARADAIKFQTYRTENLVGASAPKADYQASSTGGGSQFAMLKALELPVEAFHELKRHCVELGLDFMTTAFDSESLEDVARMNPVCLKWPSGELDNTPMLAQAAGYDLPILLSTGMGSLTEISRGLDVLSANGCDDVVILQCVSNYPARIEDQNLRAMANMSAVFGKPVGFSDHTIGPFAAIAARALGMAVLEKHFTLDSSMEGPDHAASIEPAEFAEMVSILRQIEAGLGDGVKKPLATEKNVRDVARKSLVYKTDLTAGHTLGEADIMAKRPGGGLGPSNMELVLGRVLARDVLRDEQIGFADVV